MVWEKSGITSQGIRVNKKGLFFSKKSLTSIPWLIGGKTVTFFIYFAISIVIVRGLTVSEYGTYSLLMSIGEYVNLFAALGLNFAILRFVPELVSQKNISGLRRLLVQSSLAQLASFVVCIGMLYLFRDVIAATLHINFSHYVAFLSIIMLMFLCKEFLNNSLTALYRTKLLSFLTIAQACVFLFILLAIAGSDKISIETVILSYSFSIFVVTVVSIFYLIRLCRVPEEEKKSRQEIGWKRVLLIALPIMGGNVFNRLMEQYSEIFFLGYFTSTTIVAYYSLGLFLPNIVITFIPLTIYSLLVSAVSEAYTKNKESLPQLIYGVYEILIFICVPISAFGVLFCAKIIYWVYGAKMLSAAPVAGFFFLFKLFPLFWFPLSVAIIAKEKVHRVLWFEFLPLIVNLPLDYFLIKYYGMLGAVLSVVIAFSMTFPLKVHYVKKVVGGIYFPYSFFSRILLAAFGTAALHYFVFWFVHSWGLLFVSLSYGCVFLAVLKIFRLIHSKDVDKYKQAEWPAFTRVLDYLVSK